MKNKYRVEVLSGNNKNNEILKFECEASRIYFHEGIGGIDIFDADHEIPHFFNILEENMQSIKIELIK